jgi:hypothetical protein
MPHLSVITYWLWAIGTAATGVVLALTYLTGYYRRWPSLCSYLCLIMAQAGWCWFAKTPAHYFYGYWAFQFAIDAAVVWMIVQIALSVAGITPRLQSMLRRGILAFMVVAFLVSLNIALTDDRPSYGRIVYVVQHVEIAAYLSFSVSTTALVVVTKGMGVQWKGVRCVTVGLILGVVSSDLSMYLDTPSLAQILNIVQGALYLIVLIIWGASAVQCSRFHMGTARCFQGEF